MIFIDSNVPMYVVGAEHPNKGTAIATLERLIEDSERMVTDAEVVQEILHRYTAISRADAIVPCVDALLGLVDEVFDVTLGDTLVARDHVLGSAPLSARDAIHVAVMQRHGVRRIFSFDEGFDRVEGIERIRTPDDQ